MEVHNITWRGINIEIVYVHAQFELVDHVQLYTHPRTPLPMTETGYRSHFIAAGSVAEYGGALAYVTDWLDTEAERVGWNGAQMSLF
ncbi:hypothetical protein [Phaeobacter inhibens]|uniref:hypothetical protein n=1 Tax=Phaeobacter inhibens TaxID=221822 RepID=UPI0024B7554F|nr:hypothetical protein [Phaeobacter inhibens]WHP69594.1 hypothetical protein QMZ01_05265 [Phaeobacter inhibens]